MHLSSPFITLFCDVEMFELLTPKSRQSHTFGNELQDIRFSPEVSRKEMDGSYISRLESLSRKSTMLADVC
jgi:hypothetical protein